MRETLSVNRLRLFLYREERMRKRLRYRLMCSIKILALAREALKTWSISVILLFLEALIGIRLMKWILCIPLYALSARIQRSSWIIVLLSLKILKSCIFPLAKATFRTSFVSLYYRKWASWRFCQDSSVINTWSGIPDKKRLWNWNNRYACKILA